MAKLELTDDLKTVMLKLAEGNPGAIRVSIELFKASPIVDPKVGAMTPLMWLDAWEIYGPQIWLLYKDICGEDIVRMLTVIRAAQLGVISSSEITTALQLADAPGEQSHHGFLHDFDRMLEQVRERVPEFARAVPQTGKDPS